MADKNIKATKAEAPVKPEFIIERHVFKSIDKRVDEVVEHDQKSDSPPPSKKPKKNRGQNKKRDFYMVQRTKKPCPNLYSVEKCSYDGCQNLHTEDELNGYLDTKLPDIFEECPVFSSVGYCSSGLTCRFAAAHLDGLLNVCKHGCVIKPAAGVLINGVDAKQYTLSPNKELNGKIEDDTAADDALELEKNSDAKHFGHTCLKKVSSHCKNLTPRPLLQSLRKNNVNLSKTADYMQRLQQEKAKVDPNQERFDFLEIEDQKDVKLRIEEIKRIDFADKLYLAPLTTVGNLPYRRVCKTLGVDVTCGEMALADDIIKGGFSEHALLRRHESEDLFGVQLCAPNVDQIVKAAEFLGTHKDIYDVDFVDINMGCPIDLIYQKGAGSALISHPRRVIDMVNGVMYASELPCTVKLRTGVKMDNNIAHKLIYRLKKETRVNLITLHGRSREQRYTKLADWDYINTCAMAANPIPLFGNGDCFSFVDYENIKTNFPSISGVMLARGALIKPWVFTEIKERRHWDISASERLDILKDYVRFGLEHWGSDDVGVEKTRKFLLEWISFLCRYIPVGLLEVLPQKLNERPPNYFGRNDLETLMASGDCKDWIKLTEMLLGPVPDNYFFIPKHKANSFAT